MTNCERIASMFGRSAADLEAAVSDALDGGGLERLKEFGIGSQQLKAAGWTGSYQDVQGIETLKKALDRILRSMQACAAMERLSPERRQWIQTVSGCIDVAGPINLDQFFSDGGEDAGNMTKRERIAALEKQVAELEQKLNDALLRLEISEEKWRTLEQPYVPTPIWDTPLSPDAPLKVDWTLATDRT